MFKIMSASSNNLYLPRDKGGQHRLDLGLDLDKYNYIVNSKDLDSFVLGFIKARHLYSTIVTRLYIGSNVPLIRTPLDAVVGWSYWGHTPSLLNHELLLQTVSADSKYIPPMAMSWINQPPEKYPENVNGWDIVRITKDSYKDVERIYLKKFLRFNLDKFFKPESDIYKLITYAIDSFHDDVAALRDGISIVTTSSNARHGVERSGVFYIKGDDIIAGSPLDELTPSVIIGEYVTVCVPLTSTLVSSFTDEIKISKIEDDAIVKVINEALDKDKDLLLSEDNENALDEAITDLASTEYIYTNSIVAVRDEYILADCLYDIDIKKLINKEHHKAIDDFLETF